MLDGLITAIVLIVIVGPPIVGTFWWAGRMARRHFEYVERLGERGTTYTGDLMMRFALIIFWLGAMFAGLSLLPLLIWLATDDMDGRRTFFGMLLFAVVTLGLSLVLGAYDPPVLKRLVNAVNDFQLSLLKHTPPSPLPLIVEIDEHSLEELGDVPASLMPSSS